MANKILRQRAVSAKTQLGKSAIYDKIQKGEFPAPIPLGARAVGWVEAEVDHWIEGQIAKRDNHLGSNAA